MIKILSFIALLAPIVNAAAAQVTLRNGQQVETGLKEVRLIAELKSASNQLYILVAGRDCTECDENTSLYIGKLDNGKLAYSLRDKRNEYPGVLKDYESGELALKTRVFFGHCMSDLGDQVVWFQEYPIDSGKWANGEYATILDMNGLKTKKYSDRQPDFQRVLRAAKLGKCYEIPGIDGTTEP